MPQASNQSTASSSQLHALHKPKSNRDMLLVDAKSHARITVGFNVIYLTVQSIRCATIAASELQVNLPACHPAFYIDVQIVCCALCAPQPSTPPNPQKSLPEFN